MEQKTKVVAEEGKQEMFITRVFDLPVGLLFRAHAEAALVEQWMGTKVVSLDSRKNGSYEFRKTDDQGNVLFQANGVFHEFIQDKKIIRTFQMGNAPIGVQLEVYNFEPLTDGTSKLTMHVLYETVAQRDQVIQYGMSQGIGMAHDRIQAIAEKLK